MLYIVRFLHQTTTAPTVTRCWGCCISSVSYIKPQPLPVHPTCAWVVYRPFPTSNHNQRLALHAIQKLYIVRFLHQTTTDRSDRCGRNSCISSVSYIKPQPTDCLCCVGEGCISSVSYIKPQPNDGKAHTLCSCISSVSYIKPQLMVIQQA